MAAPEIPPSPANDARLLQMMLESLQKIKRDIRVVFQTGTL